MEFMAMLIKIVSLISEACRNAEKLPVALMSAGVFQAAAALALAFFKAPGGILLHHGRAPVYLYYGVLIATMIFGLGEAYAGFWVSGDLTARQAVGKTIRLSPNSPPNSTIQKEDSPSDQNVGKYMEY